MNNNNKTRIKNSLRTALIGLLYLSAAAYFIPSVHAAPQTATKKTSVPNIYELTILVNATIAALNHANLTGNYSVLRDLSAPAFRKLNSIPQLRKIFAAHRERQLDISAALLYSPVFTSKPHIDRKGYLRLIGHMPTEPFHMKFSLIYEKSDAHWRIMAIWISPDIKPTQKLAQR